MEPIGVLPVEQMRDMYQWYLSQKQLPSQQTKNYPQRRPIDEPSPHRVFVYNTGSEIIPPYACMRVTGTRNINNVTAIDVEKPTSTDGEFLFNSQFPIAVPSSTETGVGWAFRFGVVIMTGADPTEPGAEYLPIVGSWEIEEGAGPFIVYGHHRANEEGNDRALIGRISTGRSQEIYTGVVRARLDPQIYQIELGSLPRSVFGNQDLECLACDPCTEVFGAGTADCGLAISDPDSIVQVNGTRITAYDPFSDKIPLIVGTDCVVARVRGTGAEYGNYGNYGNGEAWVVLNGYHEHIVQYKENWDCCDPDGPPTLISKTPVILIGKECDTISCESCP